MEVYKFAIKKIKKKNGDLVHIPMAKESSKIKMLNLHDWQRIIKVYDIFELTSNYLESYSESIIVKSSKKLFNMTPEECIEHIEGFKQQQEILVGEETETIEMVFAEDLEPGMRKLAS